MTLMLMFDRAYSEEDEMRFSLFKFKVNDQVRRPAWDFQYVIHRVATGKQYGFRGRLVWKKFESADDCLQEYETWAAALPTPWHRADLSSPGRGHTSDRTGSTQVILRRSRLGPAAHRRRDSPELPVS